MLNLISIVSHVLKRISTPSAGQSWGGGNKPPGC